MTNRLNHVLLGVGGLMLVVSNASAEGWDEAGSFRFRWAYYDVAQAGQMLPPVTPALPPGFDGGDAAFVANASDLTLIDDIGFSGPGLIGVMRNGNFGLGADIVVRNNTGASLDFSTIIIVLDITKHVGGSPRFIAQAVPSADPEGDFDLVDPFLGSGTVDQGLPLTVGFVIEDVEILIGTDTHADAPLRGFDLSPIGALGPDEEAIVLLAFDLGIPAPLDDCNGNYIADSGEPDTDGDGVIDDCDLCPAQNFGILDVNGDGCADTVDEVGQALEDDAPAVFDDLIDEILQDPGIPDDAADSVQNALDEVIGNNDGDANNGAADKLLNGNLVAAIVKIIQAVEDLQDAADEGADTTAVQELITGAGRAAIVAAIEDAEVLLGPTDPSVVAAHDALDAGDVLLAGADLLGALDEYKTAAQALP